MVDLLDLSEQYKDDEKLSTRKRIHRTYSVNKIDTQEEAIRRIGNATSVLDIGCGGGEVLLKLRSKGFKGRLKGIDKYDIFKKVAKFSKEKNLDIEFEQIDIAKQTESNNWDVGVMVSILVYVPEFRDVIKRYSKICKKIVMVDVGPEGYPRLHKVLLREIEEMFNLKMKTLGIGFSLYDAIIELMKYYETINIQKLDDAFRFLDADPIVEYFNTHGRGAWIPEPTESKWNEILAYVRSVAQKEIEANGVWIEPKPYYVVIAENPVKKIM